MNNPHIGSSFDEFLEDEGILAEVEAAAVKRVLAWQIMNACKEQNLTKTALAARMRTSRSQVNRLLDPTNNQVQLDTIQKAATALGHRLVIEFV